jgi:hypothetical protein
MVASSKCVVSQLTLQIIRTSFPGGRVQPGPCALDLLDDLTNPGRLDERLGVLIPALHKQVWHERSAQHHRVRDIRRR